ncbi:uncharacterized protein N7443_005060 [Penicillium atrosanguineum]|uniref:uncharacterized protein n=1 Tax=Penicillium atrosanguineum TaxID=1132637 RepID=UPI00239D78FC|nr:uncharacterized protein N7443_005060 [Penicillium atrosanguineum]KAJ5305400.1 hypothetical protein N7443_005060 [Penicillium atrosanguineum]
MELTGVSVRRHLIILLQLLDLASHASAKAVFAHFMMASAAQYEVDDFKNDISLAKGSHIDAFALNMAYGVSTSEQAVANVFNAAESLGFQLFFSFDYAGNGSWPQSDVIAFLQKYSLSSAHYKYGGKPFVSTFEGPDNAGDWSEIKEQTGCFFVPDWSSIGAQAALQLAGGVVDGLFSWAAWPTDGQPMDTYIDASYLDNLKGKPYLMPASPWFYADMPGYDKDWAYHGDDLWYSRWVEVAFLEPEWVEIISWNDYGESHYIGPLNEKGYGVFTTGKAPYNYARNMPHDGWRLQLPYVIDLYKGGTASITEENLVVWYRTQPGTACAEGQKQYKDRSFQDRIFFSALLRSNASVKVSIDGIEKDARWEFEPNGGIGIYHGNFDFDHDHLGETTVSISRDGEETVHVNGRAITETCTDGFANFNAWVGSATSGTTFSPVAPKLSLSKQVCIKGSGSANYTELCETTCRYGYCPIDTCCCTAMGAQKKRPKPTYEKGTPKSGDESYSGLCSFACYYGFCLEATCSGNQTATHSHPHLGPPACVGNGDDDRANLHNSSCATSGPHAQTTHVSNAFKQAITSVGAPFGIGFFIYAGIVFGFYF